MLQFDEAAHRYTWNGKHVPNVTSVLAPLVDLSMIPRDTLEVARQKGVAVHKMAELHCKGDLDEDSLPEWMQPAMVQWKKFVAESGFKMIASEYRVYHPTYGYAGTLDLFGTMNGDAAFIDIKRSFAAGAAIGVQLAAYLEAYTEQEKVGKNAKRYALKLNENGAYRLEPFTDRGDWSVFLALLTLHKWKEKHK